MNKHLKKFFSFFTVAVILLSTLLIGASAASTFQVNFALNYNTYDGMTDYDLDIQEAIKNDIHIYFEDPQGGGHVNYTGSAFSSLLISDSNTSITIENYSAFDFRFELVVPGSYSFGNFTIPASDGVNPGVYSLKLSYIFAKVSSASQVTLWFKSALPPVARYNINYANINIYTGSTLYKTQKVYAPQKVLGAYTDSIYNLCRSGALNLPDELNGYKIDMREYDFNLITIDPYKVNTYNVYYDLKINSSYTILYAVTPNGRQEIYRLYAPSGWIGDYVYDVHDLCQDDGCIPTYVDGYSFNPTVSPEYITVYSDRIVEVDLHYTDIGADKTIKINYYDQNGNIINQVDYRVSSLGSSFKIPSQDGYLFAPSSVPLTLGLLSESFDVYMIDFTGEREAAYQKGLAEGLVSSQKDFDARLNQKYVEGYDQGFKDGYEDGSVITGKERKDIMSEYNAITGIFDGWFNAIWSGLDVVFNGIAIGGITLGNVIWTLVIIAVVVLVGSKVL